MLAMPNPVADPNKIIRTLPRLTTIHNEDGLKKRPGKIIMPVHVFFSLGNALEERTHGGYPAGIEETAVYEELARQANFTKYLWEATLPQLYEHDKDQTVRCMFLRPDWKAITDYDHQLFEMHGAKFPEELAGCFIKQSTECENGLISFAQGNFGKDNVFVANGTKELVQTSAAFVKSMGAENVNVFILGEYTSRCEAYEGQKFAIDSGIPPGNVFVLRNLSVDAGFVSGENSVHARANAMLGKETPAESIDAMRDKFGDPESSALKTKLHRLGLEKIDEAEGCKRFEMRFIEKAKEAVFAKRDEFIISAWALI